MYKTMSAALVSLGMSLCCTSVQSAEFEIGQLNKEFTVTDLKIKVGDSVNFPNQDPFFHNVFSLSDVQMFDLGSYPKGESKTIVFDVAGTVEVECAIHPNMRAVVMVEE